MADTPSAPRYPRLRKLIEIALAAALGAVATQLGLPAEASAAESRWVAPVPVGDLPPAIAGRTEYPAHALVKLKAENLKPGSAALWRVSPRAGVDRATTAADRFEFAAPPGTYDVELLVITKSGDGFATEELFARVVVGAKADPKPDPKPEKKPNAVQALGRIQFGNSSCTATVIGPRRADGRWDVLTASHCMKGVGAKGVLHVKDGRQLAVRVVVHQTTPDLAWLVTESATEDLAYANLAAANPAAGVAVWHAGYGIDVPQNREDGEVKLTENADGQTQFVLSVSPGDSGGGIFRADTDELVSTVCCTAGLARKTDMWGASVAKVRAARPGAVRLDELPEAGGDRPPCRLSF